MGYVNEGDYIFMPILSEEYCELLSKKKEKFEVGRLCLDVYENLEIPLGKLGIKIMLNIYDTVECYVQENQEMMFLCMTSMIYYLISKSPRICTIAISSKLDRDRIWISLYEEKNIGNNSKSYSEYPIIKENDESINSAIQIVIDYMENNNFKLEFANSDRIWKIGIGFPIIKEGV